MIDTSAMSPEDAARVAASDASLAGIIAGRRRAARALIAPPGPAAAVKAGFKALELAALDAQTGAPGSTPGGLDADC